MLAGGAAAAPGLEPYHPGGSNVVNRARALGTAVLVDSGPPEVQSWLQLLKKLVGALPLVAAFKTHWHPAHTGANEALVRARHDDHRAREHAALDEHRVLRRPGRPEPTAPRRRRRCRTIRSMPPSRSRSCSTSAATQFEYGHLPEAHTDGDIYVRLRQRNVLAAGGTASGWRGTAILVPSMGGRTAGSWTRRRSCSTSPDAERSIVPDACAVQRRAHHDVGSRHAHHDARPRRRPHREGKSVAEMLAARSHEGFRRATRGGDGDAVGNERVRRLGGQGGYGISF